MTEVERYQDPDAVTRADLLDPETDSWVASIKDVVKLAGYICDTQFVPAGLRGSAPATAATILYGREIGIAPITALQTMHVVNGKVGMAAELMRARVLAAGHELEIMEHTSALCRMRGRRRGSQTWTEVQWSMGDAQRAKLGGDAWQKYPRAMLLARASSELCTAVFPDVTKGMAALEALDETATVPVDGAATQQKTRKLVTRQRTPKAPQEQAAPVVDEATPLAGGPAMVTQPGVSPELPPLPGEEEQQGTPVTAELFGGVARDPDAALPLPIPEEQLEADPRAQAELKGDGPATQPQGRHIHLLLRKIGAGQERSERLAIAEAITQKRLESFSQLSITDAGRLITTLLLAADSDQPRDYLRWLVDEGQRLLAEREAADRDAMAQADSGVGDE